ncbi:hypothetical protein D9V37_16375 [Nocardioides mangrovicus]|uniref:Alkylphosphonate transporter n=1 Tax=Nocardioides mangrovicus TaxID=2478913 RepID=A0A3L8P030_9ACTN|nr:hypothetical protein D9V37_16375 [Nocardioides mangrovicus]
MSGERRGRCPSCGSDAVTHVLFGMPADPGGLAPWMSLGGCVVDGAPSDRHCETCGYRWIA